MRNRILKLNAIGKVIEGKYPGTLICIRDDRNDKNGHFILFKDLEREKTIFLDWVKDYQELREYFNSFEWKIDWE